MKRISRDYGKEVKIWWKVVVYGKMTPFFLFIGSEKYNVCHNLDISCRDFPTVSPNYLISTITSLTV